MADASQLIDALDMRDEDGVRRASLTFSISLFTGATFAEMPHAPARCLELFLALCPPQNLRYYATENMRKHRAINKKVLDMPALWASQPETKTEYVSLELKDGDSELDAPKYLFKFASAEKGSPPHEAGDANSVTMTFPPSFGLANAQQMQDLLLRLLSELRCTCATAGFAFQCSRYSPRLGETFAWQKSMRHPEVDIVRIPQDHGAVQSNALKTVSWLTMVCDRFVQELGGAAVVTKGLGKGIVHGPVPGGLLLRIGDLPTITDRNRGETTPDYKRLHMALRPLVERAREQAMWFSTDSDDQDQQTEDWFRRFEK